MNEESRCRWIDMAVLPRFSWPNKVVVMPFEDRLIYLSPRTEELTYRVSVLALNELSLPQGASLLNRFLSCLSWSLCSGVESLWIMGSNHAKRPGLLSSFTNQRSGMAEIQPWPFLYLPVASDSKQKLALALYREGLNMSSALYSVLSFFKILNIENADGKSQKEWIKTALPTLMRNQRFADLVSELKISEPLENHLWEKSRCAVAHAYSQPIVNPDDYASVYRMDKEARILQLVGEYCIETVFTVATNSKAFRESLELYQPFNADTVQTDAIEYRKVDV